jgi:hypothetical protein
LRAESIRHRFDFYCTAETGDKALQKFTQWANQHPGDYRSISAGFSLSPEQLPKGVAVTELGAGLAVAVR